MKTLQTGINELMYCQKDQKMISCRFLEIWITRSILSIWQVNTKDNLICLILSNPTFEHFLIVSRPYALHTVYCSNWSGRTNSIDYSRKPEEKRDIPCLLLAFGGVEETISTLLCHQMLLVFEKVNSELLYRFIKAQHMTINTSHRCNLSVYFILYRTIEFSSHCH